jgi:hypothetical protein
MKKPNLRIRPMNQLDSADLDRVRGGTAFSSFMEVLKSTMDSKSETQKALARIN